MVEMKLDTNLNSSVEFTVPSTHAPLGAPHQMSKSGSGKLEKKLDNAIVKGYEKAKGTSWLRSSKSKDVPKGPPPIDRIQQRADEEQFRADTLQVTTNMIVESIFDLPERWKPAMGDLFRQIDQDRQVHANKQEVLPIVLVNTLITFYENQWKLRLLSERWDFKLWKEVVKMLSDPSKQPDEETRGRIEDYERQLLSKRERDRNELKVIAEKVHTQSETIERLKEENRKLQEQHRSAKEENDHVATQVLVDEQKKHRGDLAKLEEKHNAVLQMKREEYDSLRSQEQEQFHRVKLDLQTKFQRLKDDEISSLREKHNMSINSHLHEYSLLQVELEDTRRSVREKVEEARAESAGEERRLKAEIEKRRVDFNEHLAMVKRNTDAEKEEVRETLGLEILTLRLEISNLTSQISETDKSHHEHIRQIDERHLQALQALEDTYKDAEEKQEQKYAFAVNQQKERSATREQEMEEHFEKRQQEAETEMSSLRNKIIRMEDEHRSEKQQMTSKFEREKDEMEDQFAAEVTRLGNGYAKKIAQLEATHNAATSQLRNDVEAYSAALLARDDFKPMSDNEIKSKFANLSEDVKTLGRLEWKADQKVWTTQVLKRLSNDNTSSRLFKRQILQEMIWIILHKHIFCSPFRPFGDEGQIMENKWNTAYGSDPKFENGWYTWPLPEMEAERWRYANVKECRNALRQVVETEWDPRAKLKMGFRATLADIRDEFSSTIGEMVDLEKSHIQAMDKLAVKAANVWLEFGMQRCRIVMVFGLSSLKPAAERIRRTRDGFIELIVIPELKRYGNSKGLELHTEATVSGCGGEKVSVPMQ